MRSSAGILFLLTGRFNILFIIESKVFIFFYVSASLMQAGQYFWACFGCQFLLISNIRRRLKYIYNSDSLELLMKLLFVHFLQLILKQYYIYNQLYYSTFFPIFILALSMGSLTFEIQKLESIQSYLLMGENEQQNQSQQHFWGVRQNINMNSRDSDSRDDIESRLSRLRAQIYRPYKSVLSTQNEQQSSPMQSIVKNHSMELKANKEKNLLFKKKSVRLPSIMKKSSINTETNLQPSITDFVADPYINGKIKHQRQTLYATLSINSNQHMFLQTVEKNQLEFLENCYHKRHTQAENVITRLLNYTIDLDLINQLSFSLKILGDFHLECFESDKSFFYYNEGRKCGHLIGQQNLMAECLIQMAICASRSNLYADAIRLLKKALEYIWYYDLTSLQLKVYDQIGKVYFMMGDIEKAKSFHYKFFTGSIEPKNSSIRLLSKQSLVLEGLDKMIPIKNVTSVFLWMIHLPIKNCKELEQLQKPISPQKRQSSPRKSFSKDMKYFSQFLTLRQTLNHVFRQSVFRNELGEMHYEKIDWQSPLRLKKYLSLDIQRNNHLKSLGIPFQNYFNKEIKMKIKSKRPHHHNRAKQKRIKTETNAQNMQSLQSQASQLEIWFKNMTSQAIKKHQFKNDQISNRVNLRGIDKHHEPSASTFRLIYNQYFDLVGQKSKKSH